MTAPRRIFNIVVFLVGAGVLALLLVRMGEAGLRRVFVTVGVAFVAAAACDLGSIACDAFAVRAFVQARGAARVPFLRVAIAQASGVAINRLTPANSLGEATKVTMLLSHVPRDAAVSAVVMFNVTTIFFGILAIVVGVPTTLLLLDLPRDVEIAVWIGTGVLVAFAVAVALVIRRGAVGSLVDAARRLHAISPARAARWHAQTAVIDTRIRAITTPGSGLARALLGVVGSRAFNWAGTLALLHAADLPVTPPLVIATLSVGILVTWMSNIIPLGVGLAEAYNFALYGALGAGGAAGLDYTMINRARTIVLASLGLAIMGIAQLGNADTNAS